mmetsp:Transcript_35131/g.113771  ORF Transcript_35131/g.113771 Transcript_35131/m.113771 type:complete len:272 (+) Transcript_35131:99-914(+)
MLAADTEEPTLAAPAAPAGAVPAAVEPQTAAPVSTPAAVPSAAGYPAGEAAKAPVAPAHAAAADTARTVAETSAAPIAAADTTAALATAVGETTADGEVPTAAETSPSSESGAEAASVDLPAAAQAGLYGRLKEKAAPVVQRVAEMESVQKATQYVVDTSKVMHQKVSESERIQQSVDFVRRKTTELAESERLQKGIEVAKESGGALRHGAGLDTGGGSTLGASREGNRLRGPTRPVSHVHASMHSCSRKRIAHQAACAVRTARSPCTCTR